HSIWTEEVRAVGINLDPIDSVADLLAHGFASTFNPIYFLHAFRQVRLNLPGVIENGIGAGDIHGATGDLHARPGNNSGDDGLAKVDVSVARAFRLEIAKRGETVFEGESKRPRRTQSAIRDGLFQNLIVVFCGGDVRLKKYMSMRLNETGHAGAGDGDRLGAR